jgi:hypothetical protein
MSFDPVVSVILGLTLLQEGLDTTAAGKVVGVMALVVALGGIGVLARRREGTTAAKPVHGTHVVGAKTIAGSGPPRPVPADPAG